MRPIYVRFQGSVIRGLRKASRANAVPKLVRVAVVVNGGLGVAAVGTKVEAGQRQKIVKKYKVI